MDTDDDSQAREKQKSGLKSISNSRELSTVSKDDVRSSKRRNRDLNIGF